MVIASRRSQLAMIQSRHVQGLLMELQPALEVVIMEIVTSGDKILDSPLS